MAEQVSTYLDRPEIKQRHLDGLIEFVRIASVSTDPGRVSDLRRGADYVAEACRQLGFDTVLHETARHPVVVARSPRRDDRRNLLLYGHYDVQPAEDGHLWSDPPFAPVVRDNRLYGRGASDNKGQIWAHLCALRALRKTTGELPLNFTVVVEGEEEIGSPNLAGVLETLEGRADLDLAVVSDTSTVVKFAPTIHYSLRGICFFEIHLKVADRDVHSGVFGGTSPNAVNTLCRLISQLHDENLHVSVPGFYARVRPIADWEQANLDRIDFAEEPYQRFIGARQLIGEAGYSTNQRRWFRPTLDCNGIAGGFQGEGSKTIVPARASAKLSARLVADQDPAEIRQHLESWFQAHCPEYAELEFRAGDSAHPYLVDPTGPARGCFEAAERAIEQAFGKRPVLCRHGGSIPIVSAFRDILGIDTLLIGLGSPDDAIHSPNEKFELANFYRGIQCFSGLWQDPSFNRRP